jgi:hypothetical protein
MEMESAAESIQDLCPYAKAMKGEDPSENNIEERCLQYNKTDSHAKRL